MQCLHSLRLQQGGREKSWKEHIEIIGENYEDKDKKGKKKQKKIYYVRFSLKEK